MRIYKHEPGSLNVTNPECADCGRSIQPEEVEVISKHILCARCAAELSECSDSQRRKRLGAMDLKRLVPLSEIGSLDIRSDPAFIFSSAEDVTRDHWEEMVKRLHGLARSILKGRTGANNHKLVSEISTKIVRGLLQGANSPHATWKPEECPNLLRWLADAMVKEINILVPVERRGARNKRQPWQTIELPVQTPDESREHRGVDFKELRKLGMG